MKKLALNFSPAWTIKSYGKDNFDDSGALLGTDDIIEANTCFNGSEIKLTVHRPCTCGDFLAPEEFIQYTIEETLGDAIESIPFYYRRILTVLFSFQDRDAAYFVEQHPGEQAATIHAVVQDENGWCSFITVWFENWEEIGDPLMFLTLDLEESLTL